MLKTPLIYNLIEDYDVDFATDKVNNPISFEDVVNEYNALAAANEKLQSAFDVERTARIERQKECEKLAARVAELEEENKRLGFMVENGLGSEDMENDFEPCI